MNKKQKNLLLQEAEEKVENGSFPFHGSLMALTSMLYGLYVYFNAGYIINTIDPHFNFITEGIISFLTVTSSVILLIGLSNKNGHIKRTGVVLMSFTWGLIFTLTLVWSLTAGYPAPNFIIYGYFLFSCLIVSYKGDFN